MAARVGRDRGIRRTGRRHIVLYQLQSLDYPAFVFHVVFRAAVRAIPLPHGIEASVAAWTVYGGNREAGRLRCGDITAEGHVDALARFNDFIVDLPIVNPPCAQRQMQKVSLYLHLAYDKRVNISHFQNIVKTGINGVGAAKGEIAAILGKNRHS